MSNRVLRFEVLALVLLCLPLTDGVGAEDPRHPSISPGEMYPSSIINIRAPKSLGWVGLIQQPTEIAFARPGKFRPESDIAAVILFPITGDPDADAFLAQTRNGIDKDTPTPQFEILQSNLEISQARPYICASYRATSIDHGEKPSFFSRKQQPLQTQVVALYCKHPDKKGLGFAITFSHRGVTTLATIDEEANAFIEGVEVPTDQTRPNNRIERPREP